MFRSPALPLILSLFLGASAPLLAQNLGVAPAAKGSLLTEIPGPADPGTSDPGIVASTPVSVDWGLLDSLDPAGGDILEIRLAEDASYLARFERREHVEATGGHNWYGSLVGKEGSSFVLARRDLEVHATFHPLDGDPRMLRLWPRGANQHYVRTYASGVARCDGNVSTPASPEAGGGSCDENPAEIRLLCVVTPQGMQAEPSWVVIIQGAVAQLNLDLLSLQTAPPTRAVLVGPVLWNYRQSCPAAQNAYTLDVNALAASTEVAAQRMATRADLVAAFLQRNTSCTGTTAGRAHSIGTPGTGFEVGVCVNAINFASDVMPHEVGHLLGACHQFLDSSCGGVSYNRAHEFVSGGQLRRTRMWAEISSAVVPVFSNPSLLFNGIPTGTASIDNARRIREVRQNVANYYRAGYFELDRTACRGVSAAGSINDPPELGKTMRMSAAGPFRNGLLFFGFQSTTFGGIPLPLELGLIGNPGCYINVSPDMVIASSTVPVIFQASIPVDPTLVCFDLWFQFMLFDSFNDPSSWGWSQRIRGHIGGLSNN